ncbi:MAG TPA: glycosyltransferase family 2 protein [Pyrinomonadaceae bacterium]
MKLDVLVATYNRCDLLGRALASLLAAEVPPGLDVRVTVVDNNSKDRTRQVTEEWQEKAGGKVGLSYLFEGRQGKSHALNTGIAATDGDLVGMIDDDEEVDARWYARAAEAFEDEGVDFVGGPYYPRWGAPQPVWLPESYRGVIGWVEAGDRVLPYDENYPGVLMGGNAVFRRSLLRRVGPYSTNLGRTDRHLLACEDEDMYQRVLAAGGRGLYLPDLVIYHYIPPERLTKSYYRRWCFWRAVSHGVMDRERRSPVAYLLGVPRWFYGKAARGLLGAAGAALGRDAARGFAGELEAWNLAGFIYGKHFYRPAGASGRAVAGKAAPQS